MKSEYDSFADEFSATRKTNWAEFDFLKKYIHPCDRIADLGCGNARLRKFLPKNLIPDGNYFGLDISKKLLAIARKNFPRDHFFLSDFSKKLPFENCNFDVVSAIASFHHILSKKNQLKFLDETFRILKPGGIVFLTVWILPRRFFWRNFWLGRVFLKNWKIPFGKMKHRRTYRKITASELQKLLEKSGFRKIEIFNFENRNLVGIGEKPKI